MRPHLALVLVATLFVACSDSPSRFGVMADLAEQVYLPTVTDLAVDTAGLADAVDGLCRSPAPERVDAAREAWSAAIGAWGRAQSTAFGPVDELRLASTIRYAVDADKVLALAATSPTAGDLASAGADVRGLDAVGVLVAGDGSEELATSGGAGRCAYASVVAHQAATAAAEVAAAWEDEFAASLSGEDIAQMNLEDGFNAMTHAVEEADRSLLSVVNGEPAIGVDTVRQLVAGAAEVYLSSDDGSRLADLVGDTEVRDDLNERFASAMASLDGLGPESSTEELQVAYAEVGEVLRGLQSSLAGQLGVTLMLSDADGDA